MPAVRSKCRVGRNNRPRGGRRRRVEQRSRSGRLPRRVATRRAGRALDLTELGTGGGYNGRARSEPRPLIWRNTALIATLLDYVLHLDKHLHVIIQDYGVWTYLILFAHHLLRDRPGGDALPARRLAPVRDRHVRGPRQPRPGLDAGPPQPRRHPGRRPQLRDRLSPRSPRVQPGRGALPQPGATSTARTASTSATGPRRS